MAIATSLNGQKPAARSAWAWWSPPPALNAYCASPSATMTGGQSSSSDRDQGPIQDAPVGRCVSVVEEALAHRVEGLYFGQEGRACGR